MSDSSKPQATARFGERTILQTSRFRVVVTESTERLPSKAIVRHPGSVCILPLLDDGRICLIRNFRQSVGRRLIELPAGTLEAGEPPEACARRELAEETGYRSQRLTPLGELYLAPGILDERAHLFLAEELQEGEQNLEPDERIENLLVSWGESQDLVRAGQIEDAKTLAALSLFAMARDPAG